MDSFLAASKAALSNLSSYKKVRVLLGNVTCDLDSAVCALVQGFSEYLDGIKSNETELAVVPLMNIQEKEYRVKTEVVYFLSHHNVSPNLLTFRDQIELKALKNSGIDMQVVMVDHHSLPEEDVFLADHVVRVIDHRPRDPQWPWPGREVQLEIVGSCATLVARNFLGKHPEAIDTRLCSLLRGPILIDTSNFSKKADRATPLDIEITETLERLGGLDPDRSKIFNEIIEAKTDISQLTPDDLLIKDLKVTAGVPIVGLPMLVKNFLESQDDILKILRNFAESRNTTIVILIGMEVTAHFARDIAIFSLAAGHLLKEKIVQALTGPTEPSLELTFTKVMQEEGGRCSVVHYTQGNLRVTRKQLLPIVRNTILSQCQC